jgi:hypothetical protein
MLVPPHERPEHLQPANPELVAQSGFDFLQLLKNRSDVAVEHIDIMSFEALRSEGFERI